MKIKSKEMRLKGAPICRGVAIGKPFFFTFVEDEVLEFSISKEDLEQEIARYRKAISRSKEEVRRLQRKLTKEKILEGAAILDAHLEMMQDPLLTNSIEELIRATKKNAESVFQGVILQYQKKFQSLANPLFRERFKDIQDVCRRVMGHLRESLRISLADIPQDSIVFSTDLTASDTAEARAECVKAIVTADGSPLSHAAIVAKAKGIPYITHIRLEEIRRLSNESVVIVDGRTGDIIFSPTPESLDTYQKLQRELSRQEKELVSELSEPPRTRDGIEITLSANIDMVEEVDSLYAFGGRGVGLFRSEYIFVSHDSFPTEQEQFLVYKKLAKMAQGLPVVIRTFDFGGDKLSVPRGLPIEKNLFLGGGALRFLLKEKDIFKVQVRAILRASAYGNVKIMFPMISALPELLEAKAILEEARKELSLEGQKEIERIPVGCMIEVPAAAMIADLLAKECDFLSIGTNDLAQYALAIDRRNSSFGVSGPPLDPSVLRMMKFVISEARQKGIPVSVCGEVASDPRFAALLVGLGVQELSLSPRYIPIVKRAIRSTTFVKASLLAGKALALKTTEEIHSLLNEEYRQLIPSDRFYSYTQIT